MLIDVIDINKRYQPSERSKLIKNTTRRV